MKKKYLILSFVSALICAQAAFSQIQSFEFGYGVTNTLSVPTGKVIRIYSLIGVGSSSQTYNGFSNNNLDKASDGVLIQLLSGRVLKLSPFNVSLGGGGQGGYLAVSVASTVSSVAPASPLLIPGPITILQNSDNTILLVYEILDNLGSSSAAQIPSQGSSVVVPTSAAGDVDVKMEQSADNVTWTECLPGTYNSSTVKRFFRLRAVEK